MKIKYNEPMSAHTSFRVGGVADIFMEPESEEEAAQAVRETKGNAVVIGNGSNIIVSDEGIRGSVICIGESLGRISDDGKETDNITVQAGAMLSAVAREALRRGLSGLEFAGGIPGTVGGAVFMNAGAYGSSMKDVLRSVRLLEKNGSIRTAPADELELDYRKSNIGKKEEIVLEAVISLKKGIPKQISDKMDELRQKRLNKQPLNLPSAGSVFKRPEGYFAGKLIEEAGLKGMKLGGAQVSEKHCGFIVNTGTASARDIYTLIKTVQDRVYEKSGIKLEPEVRFIGEFK